MNKRENVLLMLLLSVCACWLIGPVWANSLSSSNSTVFPQVSGTTINYKQATFGTSTTTGAEMHQGAETHTGAETHAGVVSIGKTGSMASGAPVFLNRSGLYFYNSKGTRYRLYSNTTGTESAGAITAVKK